MTGRNTYRVDYDVVVIGSGFGGSVAALRLTEKGYRVAVVEAPPLARALYRQAQVDQEIPVKLYAAVAQVLSYVYQLRHWSPGRGDAPRLQQPDLGADGAPDPDATEAGR